jgi:propanol-preferring alcohol dehydrogenase
MATMSAYRLMKWQQPAEFADVAVQTPAPGEVLLEVAGVGLCHTDIMIMHMPPGIIPIEPPYTLGHEIAGYVAELGAGVTDLQVGDAVAVGCVSFCGSCQWCVAGYDNYCPHQPPFRGVGSDGGLAAYIAVPRRHLVPLGDLDPVQAAPLTDAGATSYAAVKRVLAKLPPGSTALVVGSGGLGGYAIQYLRGLTQARIVAVDVAPHRLDFARELGADVTLLAADATPQALRELTDGGAHASFEFVGSPEARALALAAGRSMGAVGLIGSGGVIDAGMIPGGADVFTTIASTIKDLREVVAMAQRGGLRMEAEVFPFAQAPEAYQRLEAGTLRSRAVVTPQ